MKQNDGNLRSLGNVASAYRDVGLRCRAEYGLDGEDFEEAVKKCFEKSVVRFYREVFEAVLDDDGRDKFAIGVELRKHRSLVWKWTKKQVEMEWDSVFLGLAAFDVEMDGKFPRGRDAVRQGVVESMMFIRGKCALDSVGLPRREELECLYHVCLSAAWYEAQRTRDLWRLEGAADEIINKVRKAAPHARLRDYRDVERVIHDWLVPWLLFHTSIPYEWSF